MSVTIVLAVPFGPRPDWMKREFTTCVGPLGYFYVSVGLGVTTLESLLFLYKSKFNFFISSISLMIQSSFESPSNPLKFLFTSLLAVVNKDEMLPTWFLSWLKPPHCLDCYPFEVMSSILYKLHSVYCICSLKTGKAVNMTMERMNIDTANMTVKTMTQRSSNF